MAVIIQCSISFSTQWFLFLFRKLLHNFCDILQVIVCIQEWQVRKLILKTIIACRSIFPQKCMSGQSVQLQTIKKAYIKVSYTDRNILVNFLKELIYLALVANMHLAWNMGGKCLASKLH